MNAGAFFKVVGERLYDLGPQAGAFFNDTATTEIYTTALCPFCYRAKKLLKEKGVDFDEIDVTFDPAGRAEMTRRAGSRSVPQVFVDGLHVGDCDAIYALERVGKLNSILGKSA